MVLYWLTRINSEEAAYASLTFSNSYVYCAVVRAMSVNSVYTGGRFWKEIVFQNIGSRVPRHQCEPWGVGFEASCERVLGFH